MRQKPILTVILGPTACGKTSLAVNLASQIDGEIISADSRQVYKQMDIGTGKDISEYNNYSKPVTYHLIDIAEPGTEYNLFLYQQDFILSYEKIITGNKVPILCGGTGMYIESVLRKKRLLEVPIDTYLRNLLNTMNIKELEKLLTNYRTLHNTTDTSDKERLIRAIEIEKFKSENKDKISQFPDFDYKIFGINPGREKVRNRITQRLENRISDGMLEEVKMLLKRGIPEEKLIFYGLEYKYTVLYLNGSITYDEMLRLLNIAIHQFAKRQMTYFRKMEKTGIKIDWLDPNSTDTEKVAYMMKNM